MRSNKVHLFGLRSEPSTLPNRFGSLTVPKCSRPLTIASICTPLSLLMVLTHISPTDIAAFLYIELDDGRIINYSQPLRLREQEEELRSGHRAGLHSQLFFCGRKTSEQVSVSYHVIVTSFGMEWTKTFLALFIK